MKIIFKTLLERFALWLLRLCGTQIQTYPAYMEAWHSEILELCRAEQAQTYHTDDVLGAGYFRGRRVMSIMKKRYPQLKVRDLWKAVDICSGSMDSGLGQPLEAQVPQP